MLISNKSGLLLVLIIFCNCIAINDVSAASHPISGTVYEWCFPVVELEDVYVKLYVLKFPDVEIGEDDLQDTDYTDENGDYDVVWYDWGMGTYTVWFSFIKEGYVDIIKHEINDDQTVCDMYMVKE